MIQQPPKPGALIRPPQVTLTPTPMVALRQPHNRIVLTTPQQIQLNPLQPGEARPGLLAEGPVLQLSLSSGAHAAQSALAARRGARQRPWRPRGAVGPHRRGEAGGGRLMGRPRPPQLLLRAGQSRRPVHPRSLTAGGGGSPARWVRQAREPHSLVSAAHGWTRAPTGGPPPCLAVPVVKPAVLPGTKALSAVSAQAAAAQKNKLKEPGGGSFR